jgi:zinc and cadmium transporter
MIIWLSSLSAAFLVSGVSWVGSFTFLIRPPLLNRLLPLFVSLSVGVLLGDAFIHLLPEAIDQSGDVRQVMLFTLGGMVAFFVLEKLVRWHHHSHHGHTHTDVQAFSKMNLFGDALHNFIDGTLIAGSFMVDNHAGWLTLLAIVVHEIPQEIGDVGALIYGGYSPRKALWYNFLSALSCVAGAVFLLSIGTLLDPEQLVYFLPFSAGAFIYIAASDLIPELHNRPGAALQQITQGICMSGGIIFILALKIFENVLF